MGIVNWTTSTRKNILALKLFGLWPVGQGYKKIIYNAYAFISIGLFEVIYVCTLAINLMYIYNDFEAVLRTVFVLLSEVLAVLKALCFIFNRKILEKLIKSIDEITIQNNSKKKDEISRISLTLWDQIYMSYLILCIGAVFFWFGIPFFNGNFASNKLPFLIWVPYNYNESPQYEITYMYQICSNTVLAIATLNIDTLVVAFNVFTAMQFDILVDNISNMQFLTTEKLEYCIKFHKKILK